MGKKVNNIRKLDRMGLNRHVMCITRNIEEALYFVRANPKGSIRTDRIYESAYDLPFYVYEDQEEFEHLIPKETSGAFRIWYFLRNPEHGSDLLGNMKDLSPVPEKSYASHEELLKEFQNKLLGYLPAKFDCF